MKVNVVLKECNGETNLDWIMEKVKDVFFYDDYVEVEFYTVIKYFRCHRMMR